MRARVQCIAEGFPKVQVPGSNLEGSNRACCFGSLKAYRNYQNYAKPMGVSKNQGFRVGPQEQGSHHEETHKRDPPIHRRYPPPSQKGPNELRITLNSALLNFIWSWGANMAGLYVSFYVFCMFECSHLATLAAVITSFPTSIFFYNPNTTLWVHGWG